MSLLASDKTAVRVGAATAVGALIALIGVFAFRDVSIGSTLEINVEFDHVGALTAGADVQIAGRRIGVVRSIVLSKDGARAQLAIKQSYRSWIASNAEVFVSSKGLLSQRYLEIGPPPRQAQSAGGVNDGDTLRGVSPVRVEIVVLRSIENTKQFRALLDELGPATRRLGTSLDALTATLEAIEGSPGDLAALGNKAGELWTEMARTRQTLADANLSSERIAAIARRVRRLQAAVGREMDALSTDLVAIGDDINRMRGAASARTFFKLQLAYTRAQALMSDGQQTAAAIEDLIGGIARGEGTIGALLNDPEFIDEAKELGKVIKRQPWRLIGTDRKDRDLLVP